MAIPNRLNDSLRRTLGETAAEDLVSWMDDVDTRRAEFAEFRENLRGDFAELRQELRADMADLREGVSAKVAAVEKEVTAVRLEVRDARNEVLKWSFLFWIATLGSLFLGRMLR